MPFPYLSSKKPVKIVRFYDFFGLFFVHVQNISQFS